MKTLIKILCLSVLWFSCEQQEDVYGCTNPDACNFNPDANIFDDRFRIPLLFYGHGINEHKVINQQVRSIDIYPTIFQQVGLDISDKIDGVSLIPLISGSDMKEHPAILESRINVKEGITSNTIGVRTSKFKYFRNIKKAFYGSMTQIALEK